jgi:DNA mismatch repair protein MutS2
MPRRTPKIIFHFDRTVDLHGLNTEDAVTRIDHEVCSLDRPDSILVVHGRGDGLLRKGIRDFLSRHPLVSSVEYGETLNIPGGDGVTVVRLR